MFTRHAAALLALAVLSASPVPAHEGHDHGPDRGSPPLAASPSPVAGRAEARSARFELVAVARGRDLLLYLDRYATNEPVSDAHLTVATPAGPAAARATADGVYRLAAPWLARGGHHDLAVTVAADGTVEDLPLALALPEAPAPADAEVAPASASPPASASASVRVLRAHLAHQGPVGAAAAGFLLGLGTIALTRARLRAPALALLVLCVGLLLGGAALAHEEHSHEGHSHDETAPHDGEQAVDHRPTPASPTHHEAAPAIGDASPLDVPPAERSRRLPDGSVFAPKSVQRLLAIRTGVTTWAEHAEALELPGRIIADPNASGVVQSVVGGRLAPPPGGFPELGARVRRGDVLAIVTPPVQAVDVSDMRQTQGDLDQQIAIVARRVARYERLGATGAVAQTALDDARAELAGLQDRRAALDAIRREPETLVAPVDGAIAERAAVAGQMAVPGALVFRVADPDRLYVEALSFAALAPGEASARLPDGRTLRLDYRGTGLADRNQAVPVQFAVREATAGLRLGQFVTVLAPSGTRLRGLAVPRASVVRGEAGAVVYEHVAAERFDARPVRVEPLDAERVLVAAGLSEGRRVVTQGAELLDQVR